jgi:hypothetical protein
MSVSVRVFVCVCVRACVRAFYSRLNVVCADYFLNVDIDYH